MKILLIGANGQLGSDLKRVFQEEDLVSLTHDDVDICEPVAVKETLRRHRPQLVLNTAAYHKVDECESNVEKTFSVNVFGVRNLASACGELACTLVHLSTDYVFDGRKEQGYLETDLPNPINVYGISKLAGEQFVRCLAPQHFVVRTSGLFGVAGSSGKGGNFIELMLRLAIEKKDIKVVADQVLSPTYTLDLAEQIKVLCETEHYGLYHATSQGECSWFEFAAKIFELSKVDANLSSTTTAEFGALAARPARSVLENARLKQLGIETMRSWQEGLAAYLAAKQRTDG